MRRSASKTHLLPRRGGALLPMCWQHLLKLVDQSGTEAVALQALLQIACGAHARGTGRSVGCGHRVRWGAGQCVALQLGVSWA